jgi:hypothetical protein
MQLLSESLDELFEDMHPPTTTGSCRIDVLRIIRELGNNVEYLFLRYVLFYCIFSPHISQCITIVLCITQFCDYTKIQIRRRMT